MAAGTDRPEHGRDHAAARVRVALLPTAVAIEADLAMVRPVILATNTDVTLGSIFGAF